MPAMFKRQHSVVKIWQLIGGPLAVAPPPMEQPAQWIIRPCTKDNTVSFSLRNMIWHFCDYLGC